MATYAELAAIGATDPDGFNALRDKVRVAVVIKAQAIAADVASTAEQNAWAVDALQEPITQTDPVMNYILAANAGVTIANILSASDSAIQTNVDAAVDTLFGV